MKDTSDEITLFHRMNQDDTSALEFFVREYIDSLYYKALGFVKDSLVAEDIVQEVFIWFWDNRKRIDVKASVPGYLYRAVTNKCKNYLESQEVRIRYEQEYHELLETENFPALTPEEVEQLQKKLMVFIDRLPEKCREIFILSCVEGLKYREVAERLDVSVNTVKTQVKTAYAKLRADFDGNDLLLLFLVLNFFK